MNAPDTGLSGNSAPWNLKFADEFTGDSLDSKWAPCYPWFHPCDHGTNFGNPELEWYHPSQVSVTGGALHLTATRVPTPGYLRDGQPASYPWDSGIVTTHNSFVFMYGFVQIVARVPKGHGFWPALWLLPSVGTSPPEIDIMEVWGHDTSQVAFTNIWNRFGGQKTQAQVHLNTPDLSSAFHTYAIDWEPGSIVWYLDGKAVYRVTIGIPKQPMYLLANLAIDGKPALAPDSSTPASGAFDIQSVTIWQH